ncbi:hypothetical protein PG993_011804 [Apiospora rasikravindrae]|uniref:Uncharacterized protein n=1 Tax=Apiospora rasikravindrae TaxID=990691 RepID=A0ABR1S149_9PEZI
MVAVAAIQLVVWTASLADENKIGVTIPTVLPGVGLVMGMAFNRFVARFARQGSSAATGTRNDAGDG